MKFGMRKPSLKKSLKARTTGKLKRKIKRTLNPFYGKKGVGFIKNPTKSLKNKIYKKTTFGLSDIFKLSSGIPNIGTHNTKHSKASNNNYTEPESNAFPTGYKIRFQSNNPNNKAVFEQILNHIPGFRTRSKKHIIIAAVYYALALIIAISLKKDFLFALVLFWSVPFCIFAAVDTIKSKNLLKLLPIPICFWLLVISLIWTYMPISPTEISLSNQEITFEDINQEQPVSYSVTPENADKSKIELVSSNNEVAYFSGDVLHSNAEGETTIYAALKNSDVKSDEVHVVVKDKKAEAERAAQETARLKAEEAARLKAEEEAHQAEERAKQEAAAQEAERKAAEQAAAAKNNAANSNQSKKSTVNSSNSETVYIGETGNKYHRKSCHTLKGGGHAISLSEAKKNRKPCSICKP